MISIYSAKMNFCDGDENPQIDKSPITYETCINYLEELDIWLNTGQKPSKLYYKEDQHIVQMEEQEMYGEAVIALKNRCEIIRQLVWSIMPARPIDEHLTVKPSWLGGNSGQGLFVNKKIEKNEVICLYTGQLHSLKTSTRLEDRSYLNQVSDNLFVDPRPCPTIKARYGNDCVNPNGHNCYYKSNLKKRCVEVRALRDIHKNEELFVSYGKQYWEQAPFSPIVLCDEKLKLLLGSL